MHTPTKFWYKVDIKSKILSFIFYPFSLLWVFLDTLKRKFSNPYKSRIKIICVGNLNVGGTGKTPLCICIFKHLKNLGYNPIFLTSGYKGKIVGPAKVKENNDDFYYGDVTIDVYGDFGQVSLYYKYDSTDYGYMGGENLLVYSDTC